MATEPDYYEILQVSPKAGPEVIDAAYRRLARRYHPDVNPSEAAQDRMRELNQALEILMDPHRRADYDRRRQRSLAERAMAEKPTIFAFPPRQESSATRVGKRLRRLPAVWLAIAGVAVTALAALATVAILAGDDGSTDEAGRAATPPIASATDGQPADNSATFSDGRWLVGEEMEPGIWRAVRSRNCSWQRLASIEGDTDIVAASGSYLTVELQELDAAFVSEGCGWWTQVLAPPSAAPTEPFGPGTWLVPDEIAPGKWQNSDVSEGCSWTKLSALSGEPSTVIDSGIAESVGIMEITGSERAFDSRGCGTWTRVGD
jgi:curved DNA-binding protein CbpA